jgi:hypothetical protein
VLHRKSAGLWSLKTRAINKKRTYHLAFLVEKVYLLSRQARLIPLAEADFPIFSRANPSDRFKGKRSLTEISPCRAKIVKPTGSNGFFQRRLASGVHPDICMTPHYKETDSSGSSRAHDAARLEELLRDLAGRSGASALMREHLETARSYLLGSMPDEYNFNLKLAKHLLPDIDDKSLQTRVADFLRSQKSSIA